MPDDPILGEPSPELQRVLSAHDFPPATGEQTTCRRCGFIFRANVKTDEVPYLCRVK